GTMPYVNKVKARKLEPRKTREPVDNIMYKHGWDKEQALAFVWKNVPPPAEDSKSKEGRSVKDTLPPPSPVEPAPQSPPPPPWQPIALPPPLIHKSQHYLDRRKAGHHQLRHRPSMNGQRFHQLQEGGKSHSQGNERFGHSLVRIRPNTGLETFAMTFDRTEG
ncbi:MAG: hypothetical protein JWM47_4293, partial [Acidimicrobiales bacterium]|nr:hypothetical protein [Acidimicrobiales bacterium]